MALKTLDCCMFSTTATGTTNFDVVGAITGFQSPASAGAANGDTFYYRAESSDLTQWEFGLGTYSTTGPTLARTTVIFSSAVANAKVSFTFAPRIYAVLPNEIFAASAFTDATNAGNISAGTLAAARLPLATVGAFGAVKPDGTTVTISGGVISSTGGGGGGGYPAGTVPTVVQTAFSVNGTNSAVFGVAPTNGNLLVAMFFNPTSQTAGAGWTNRATNSSGTDFGGIYTKVAGAGESTTQTPLSGVSTTGGIVIWEIHGATFGFLTGSLQAEQSGTSSVPVLFPNITNCLSLSAIGVVTTPTISSVVNIGTQDVLDNTGTRKLAAGHTDLSFGPMAGLIALFSTTASSKSGTCLIL